MFFYDICTMDPRPKHTDPPKVLIEDQDYYIENGLYVFTQRYLLKRGYCCKCGCRHCPYGYVKPAPTAPFNE